MPENIPLVSIVCNTYNHKDFIRDAIEGFLMQKTDFPIEILIHDDASTDGTSDIIREYERKYPDLIFPIYQIENQYSRGGRPSLINRSRARGKYIAMCEGDDYWIDPLKLQKQVDFLEEHEDYVMCFHKAFVRNERVDPVVELPQKQDFNGIDIDLRFILTIWNIPTASIVFRRTEALPSPAWLNKVWSRDIALAALLYKYGKIGYIDSAMSVYRLHRGGVTIHHKGRGMVKQRMILYRNLDKYFDYKYKEDISYAKKYIRHKYSYKVLITNQIVKELKKIKYRVDKNPTMSAMKSYIRNIVKVILMPNKVKVVSINSGLQDPVFNLKEMDPFWNNNLPEEDSGDQKLPVSIVLTTIKSRSYFTNEFVIPSLVANNPSEILIIDDEDINVQEKRNKGAAMATQDYIIFCDDDKILPKHYLSILYKSLLSHPEYGYAYTDYLGITIEVMSRRHKTNFYHKAKIFDPAELRKGNYIDTCSLMRRSVFCGFDPAIRRLQDWDLWLTLAAKGIRGLYVKETGFFAFYLDEGVSSISNSFEEAQTAIRIKHGINPI